jgi:tetratricopeptide (TPR) repeat protein
MKLLPSRKWFLIGAMLTVIGTLAVATWIYLTSTSYRFQQAEKAIEKRDFTVAEAVAKKFQSEQHSDEAFYLLGRIAMARKQYARAIEQFNRIRDQGKLRTVAAAFSGESLFVLGSRREAERVLKFAVSQDPDIVSAHRFLSVIYFDQGDMVQAVEHLNEVARLDPKDAKPHRLMGVIYQDLDRPDDAIPAFEEALARSPQPALANEIKLDLAKAKLQKGYPLEAISLTDNLGVEEALPIRVEALLAIDRRDEAKSLLMNALELFPKNTALLRIQGEALLSDQKADQAVKVLETAIALDPVDYRVRYQLALAFTQTNQPEKAAEQQKKVKEIQQQLTELTELNQQAFGKPWDSKIRMKLAAVCEKLGKKQLAEMWSNAAAASGSTSGE